MQWLRNIWNAETAVYRAYDIYGRLLYVGISLDPENRWRAHQHLAEWFEEAARVDVTWCKDRRTALRLEVRAIQWGCPMFNTKDSICRCGGESPTCQQRRREEIAAFCCRRGIHRDRQPHP